jgi:hypothetical protein
MTKGRHMARSMSSLVSPVFKASVDAHRLEATHTIEEVGGSVALAGSRHLNV